MLSFLLYEKLFLVVLEFLLKSLQLNVVFLHGLFVVCDLFLHSDDLTLFLLQVLFVDWNHFLLLDWWLSFEHLLQGFQLLFLLFEFAFILFDLLSFENQTFLNGLDFSHEFIGGWVSGLEFSPTMHVHWILYLFRKCFNFQLSFSELTS